ncbi:MAG TPA: SRPBCC domain-containing protein [Candidatus Kapabacteria bacterium]|nr:SRPBCC domain-containing protein [Candidatus Kapabacteria bacterium]
MSHEANSAKRTDSGSRVVKASPQAIYRACLDPAAIALWRPPSGMSARIYEFDPHTGGTYRMSFVYNDPDHPVRGKTSEHADLFQGRFLELVPDERIVEAVKFESNDPSFAEEMIITTTLTSVPGGTEVTIRCDNVPGVIRPEDHQAGIASTLENLAAFTEHSESTEQQSGG